ncbi:MAG: hypothetical protein HY078_05370 [Elusimicrobia bacterium]|nr:hypothetical protein [Elusimicrobiota bacterium]
MNPHPDWDDEPDELDDRHYVAAALMALAVAAAGAFAFKTPLVNMIARLTPGVSSWWKIAAMQEVRYARLAARAPEPARRFGRSVFPRRPPAAGSTVADGLTRTAERASFNPIENAQAPAFDPAAPRIESSPIYAQAPRAAAGSLRDSVRSDGVGAQGLRQAERRAIKRPGSAAFASIRPPAKPSASRRHLRIDGQLAGERPLRRASRGPLIGEEQPEYPSWPAGGGSRSGRDVERHLVPSRETLDGANLFDLGKRAAAKVPLVGSGVAVPVPRQAKSPFGPYPVSMRAPDVPDTADASDGSLSPDAPAAPDSTSEPERTGRRGVAPPAGPEPDRDRPMKLARPATTSETTARRNEKLSKHGSTNGDLRNQPQTPQTMTTPIGTSTSAGAVAR